VQRGDPLRVWHLDTIGSPQSVDGVAVGLWLLAAQQSQLGADVTLFLRDTPDANATAIASGSGIHLAQTSRSIQGAWRSSAYRGLHDPPDIVHFHTGWNPSHPFLAAAIRRRHVSYVQTPHGAYSKVIRSRKRLPRALYLHAVEAPYVRRAGGVLYNHEAESHDFHDLVPRFGGLESMIPFPTDIETSTSDGWQPDPAKRVVFLGRYEPFQKGLDRLVDIAALLPDVQFELYGQPPEGGSQTLSALIARSPANVRFNPPVFGEAKQQVLRRASLYLQPSRFDGFSLSVAGAMLQGLPCAVADDQAIAEEIRRNDLGLVLPTDAARAAEEIRKALDDPQQLRRWSANATPYARNRFDPVRSAEAHLAFYAEVLARSSAK